MTSQIDQLAKLRAAATQDKTFTYNSLQGATVQVSAGWLALCHYNWREEARENAEFISFAMNSTEAIVAERDGLLERAELAELLCRARGDMERATEAEYEKLLAERDAEIERLRKELAFRERDIDELMN